MSRDMDALANVLIALCELEKSCILSLATRDKITHLKEVVELELSQRKEDLKQLAS